MTREEIAALRGEMKSAIVAAKKKEDFQETYDKFCELSKNGTLDKSLFRDFGWLIFYRLRALPLNMMLQRKRAMLQYFQLKLERPSLLHSLILSEAVKMKKNSPSGFRFRDFVSMWELENLRPEDWDKIKLPTGKSRNSLVEILIGTYVREIVADKAPATDDFVQLLEKAVSIYKSNPHLPLYKAQVMVSVGKTEDASAFYKVLLKRWPKKFFLWARAEELLPPKELSLRIAFLSKAIFHIREQAFLGDIRLKLAYLLQKQGLYSYALFELTQYERYYQSQNWHIKPWHETLKNLIEGKSQGVNTVPTPYAEFLPLADRYINEL